MLCPQWARPFLLQLFLLIVSLHKCYYIPASSDKYKSPVPPHCPTKKKAEMPIFTPSLVPTTVSHYRTSFPFHPPNFISLCSLHHTSHSYHLACPVLRLTFLLRVLGHASLPRFSGCTSSLHPLPQIPLRFYNHTETPFRSPL